MNHSHTPPNRSPWAALRWLSASLLKAGLVACGGGGGGSDDDSATPSGKSYKGTETTFDSPQSFSVDGIPVDASGSNAVPQGLATGTRVEIQGEMVNGRLQARRVGFDDTDDGNTDPNELDGRVTSCSGPTRFSVDGIAVDASAAPSTLAVGMRVEVYGAMSNGTMVSSRVKIEDRSASDDNADSGHDDLCDDVGKSACEDDGKD